MNRKITLDANTYTASIGTFDNYRVTIQNGGITISGDLDARTPGADFEAVFYGKQRVDIITAPKPEDQEITDTVPNPDYIDPETTPDTPETIEEVQTVTGPERYTIGPLELDPDETPLSLAKAAKLAEMATERWKAETGGVEVGDMRIDTSRESQAMITGAALQATIDPSYVCKWKTEQGCETLTAEQISTAAQAVRMHEPGCFDWEATLAAMISTAATIGEVQAIAWE
jgi:hypothetical protein